jgi:hypothetical protein
VIEGLKAKFKGPSKRKGAGKPSPAARKLNAATGKKEAPKIKERLRDRKNIGKRRQPTSAQGVEAGHAPLGKRRTDPPST